MKRLQSKQGVKAVDEKLRLVVIALAAVGLAEATALAEQITQWRAQIATALADHALKLIELRTANKEVARLDKTVDKATVNLSKSALDHFDQNRLHALFVLAFPIAPSEATMPLADDSQPLYVRNAIKVLRDLRDLPPTVIRRLEALEAVQTALEAGLVRRTTAREAEALSRGRLNGVLTGPRQAYNAPYFHLGRIFNNDLTKVEAIFA